jgi:S1-C subfamily serine protease
MQLGPPRPVSAPALYERARTAVVRVEVAETGGGASSASGVVVGPGGMIATNYHVIQDAASARVLLPNGKIFDRVAIAAVDKRKDIALLKIEASGLSPLPLGDSDLLPVGSRVYALGAPRGLEGSLSEGLVSAVRRGAEVGLEFAGMDIIQFTAPISSGSSGGPLLDNYGQVMGLVCGYKRGGQNLNLAIPSNYLSSLLAGWGGEVRSLKAMAAETRASQSASTAQVLARAKTLSVSLSRGSPVLRAAVVRRLLKWGRLQLVTSPDDADLVLQLVQTGGLDAWHVKGNQAAAWVKDPQSGTELWADLEGGTWRLSGFSTAWVGREIAEEFIRFYERAAGE